MGDPLWKYQSKNKVKTRYKNPDCSHDRDDGSTAAWYAMAPGGEPRLVLPSGCLGACVARPTISCLWSRGYGSVAYSTTNAILFASSSDLGVLEGCKLVRD